MPAPLIEFYEHVRRNYTFRRVGVQQGMEKFKNRPGVTRQSAEKDPGLSKELQKLRGSLNWAYYQLGGGLRKRLHPDSPINQEAQRLINAMIEEDIGLIIEQAAATFSFAPPLVFPDEWDEAVAENARRNAVCTKTAETVQVDEETRNATLANEAVDELMASWFEIDRFNCELGELAGYGEYNGETEPEYG